jgi:hypothetical protein
MSQLTALLGESPISTMGGIIGLLGLIMLLMGLVFDKDEVLKAGLGAVGTAVTIIGLAARDNRTSTKAHEESLAKISAAKDDHTENQVKIAYLTTKVEKVPEVVGQAVKQEVPQAVARALNEPPREERRR